MRSSGRLEADGWELVRQRCSHRQYRHATTPGLVTVNMREALAFHFDGLRTDGLTVPLPSTRTAVVEVA